MKNQEQKEKATAVQANEWIRLRDRMKSIESKDYTTWTEEEEVEHDALCQQFAKLRSDYDFQDVPFQEQGLFGVKDVLGNVIVPPAYEEIPYLFSFSEKENRVPYPVKKWGFYGLVISDGSGTVLLNCQFDGIEPCLYQAEYFVQVGKKYGLIDKEGKMLVPPIMDSFGDSLTAIRYFESNGKKGFLYSGGEYFPPIYEEIDVEPDAPFKVRLGNQWGWLNGKGEFTLDEDEAELGEWL